MSAANVEVFTVLPRPGPNTQSLCLRTIAERANPRAGDTVVKARDKIGLGNNSGLIVLVFGFVFVFRSCLPSRLYLRPCPLQCPCKIPTLYRITIVLNFFSLFYFPFFHCFTFPFSLFYFPFFRIFPFLSLFLYYSLYRSLYYNSVFPP